MAMAFGWFMFGCRDVRVTAVVVRRCAGPVEASIRLRFCIAVLEGVCKCNNEARC